MNHWETRWAKKFHTAGRYIGGETELKNFERMMFSLRHHTSVKTSPPQNIIHMYLESPVHARQHGIWQKWEIHVLVCLVFHVFRKELPTSNCKNTESESLDPSIDFCCMISHCLSKICIKIGQFHFFQHHLSTFTFMPSPHSCDGFNWEAVISAIYRQYISNISAIYIKMYLL